MIFLLALLLLSTASGKVYKRCDLARELKNSLRAPNDQIATWVCIAKHESGYDTKAVNVKNKDGSGDHGIFQINDRYWCSPPGKGKGCGKPCSMFEDDQIKDDFDCVTKIYKEHQRLFGEGFQAWSVWKPYCSGGKADKYIDGCF